LISWTSFSISSNGGRPGKNQASSPCTNVILVVVIHFHLVELLLIVVESNSRRESHKCSKPLGTTT
jgi:hypothetical protein